MTQAGQAQFTPPPLSEPPDGPPEEEASSSSGSSTEDDGSDLSGRRLEEDDEDELEDFAPTPLRRRRRGPVRIHGSDYPQLDTEGCDPIRIASDRPARYGFELETSSKTNQGLTKDFVTSHEN